MGHGMFCFSLFLLFSKFYFLQWYGRKSVAYAPYTQSQYVKVESVIRLLSGCKYTSHWRRWRQTRWVYFLLFFSKRELLIIYIYIFHKFVVEVMLCGNSYVMWLLLVVVECLCFCIFAFSRLWCIGSNYCYLSQEKVLHWLSILVCILTQYVDLLQIFQRTHIVVLECCDESNSLCLVCFCLSDWYRGSRPFTGYICSSVLRFTSIFLF